MADNPKATVVSTRTDMQATYPIAINGKLTAAQYGVGQNTIVVIDSQGIVRDVKVISDISTVDSLVQAAAGTVRTLRHVAVKPQGFRNSPAPVLHRAAAFHGTFDLRGRKLGSGKALIAPQVLAGPERSAAVLAHRRER